MIGFNPNQAYNLEDLIFYFPKNRNITPFLLLKDSYETKDVLKLTKSGIDKNYIIYSVSIDSGVSAKNGYIDMSILTLEDDIIKTSPKTQISLNFDNFMIAKRTAVLDEVSRNLASTYQKVEELTKMNIEIYQNIEEANK